MELIGAVKNYHWGKLGTESMVAQLSFFNRDRKIPIEDQTPYAELWMGTHPSGPSTLKLTGGALSDISGEITFLFKILSVRKPLSIQVHPTKAHAEQLHRDYPDLYQDANHKPEIAIALTPFTAMCGFRPYSEIINFCILLPPLMSLIGGKIMVERLMCECAADLKTCYENLMSSHHKRVEACIHEIKTEYKNVLTKYDLFDLFTTINEDYPGDVGVLSLFFCNVVRLNPGEAIFLSAGEIHAYIQGDCVECMSCSDNVIRAGLTPKYKDLKQLLECLTFEGRPGEEKIFKPKVIDSSLRIFIPPVKDFAVSELRLDKSGIGYTYDVPKTGAILITLKGRRNLLMKNDKSLMLLKGSIIYLPPEAGPIVEFAPIPNVDEKFLAYIAMINIPASEIPTAQSECSE